MVEFKATTICCVRRGPDDIAIGGDGQVTMGGNSNNEKRREKGQEDIS
jgi:ATP-dependent HslUV protease subunit HslV